MREFRSLKCPPDFGKTLFRSMNRPTFRRANEGRTVAVVGDLYRILVTGEETGGSYAQWEAIVPPGGGPPPHTHSREQEGFYIIEGDLAVTVGSERTVVGPGSFLNLPPGISHSFRNDSERPVRLIITVAPAGLEQMFLETGVVVPDASTAAPPPLPDEIERLLEAAPHYGITIELPEKPEK